MTENEAKGENSTAAIREQGVERVAKGAYRFDQTSNSIEHCS